MHVIKAGFIFAYEILQRRFHIKVSQFIIEFSNRLHIDCPLWIFLTDIST